MQKPNPPRQSDTPPRYSPAVAAALERANESSAGFIALVKELTAAAQERQARKGAGAGMASPTASRAAKLAERRAALARKMAACP